MIICPNCNAHLANDLSSIPKKCSNCNYKINFLNKEKKSVPIFLSESPNLIYESKIKRIGSNSRFVRFIYSFFSQTRINSIFLFEYCKRNINVDFKILVVGGATYSFGLEKFLKKFKEYIYFSDIYNTEIINVICDGHNLPFANNSFDMVISTSVLEHLSNPNKASKEISRVLKKNGFLYSELPFLQSIHEKDYDFTRYTLNGHINLFSDLEICEKGISKGFYIVILWLIREQINILSPFFSKFIFVILYPLFYTLDKLLRYHFKNSYSESFIIAKKL